MDFDYENELKINNLARDILKTARVSGSMSTAEAYSKAKEIIIGSQGNPQPTGASQPSSSASIREEPLAPKHDYSTNIPRDSKNDSLIQQLVESNKNLASEIGNIQAKMNELIAEFNKINGEISGLKKVASVQQQQTQSRDQDTQKAEPRGMPAAEQPAEHKQGSFESGAKSTHPRSGGYSPADVDINKMFYFGNK